MEGWERKKSTRGRKVTERPHPAWPSLKEKRWNTHTDLPSVNRVSKRGRERRREERGLRAREGEARRAAFVFVQLNFPPPAGLLISALSAPVPHRTTLILDKESKEALPEFFFFVAVRAATASKQSYLLLLLPAAHCKQLPRICSHPPANGSVNNVSSRLRAVMTLDVKSALQEAAGVEGIAAARRERGRCFLVVILGEIVRVHLYGPVHACVLPENVHTGVSAQRKGHTSVYERLISVTRI